MKSAGTNRRQRSNHKSSKPRRSFFLKLAVVVLLAGICVSYLILATTTQAVGEPNIFAVTSGNLLIRFNGATPNAVTTIGAVTGLTGADAIVGIDFRPATGELYALGYNFFSAGTEGQLYTINLLTAAATIRGARFSLAQAIGGSTNAATAFGFDFNPVSDQIRVVGSGRDNFRLNPTGTIAGPDIILDYAAGDPNDVANPHVVGSAYTNNFSGAASTTLFGIDTTLDILARQGGVNVPPGTPSPNTGQLFTIGPLGVNALDVLGFDMQTTSAPAEIAYAAMTTNGTSSGLYTINLGTGLVTLVGNIGAGSTLLRGIAVAPEVTATAPIFYAINSANNNLVRFNGAVPSSIISSIPITGLVGGDTIVGLDFRPATGELFGLSSGSRLYIINPTTGAATQRGTDGQFTIMGVGTGFDFNPVTDRIRYVDDFEQNFRINPNDGTKVDGDPITGGIQNDTNLAYAPGDPNSGQNPDAAGAAYTNSFSGATSTSLFGIDTATNNLFRQGGVNVPPGTPSPNGGQLFTIGALGIDPVNFPNNGNLGFDIRTLPSGTNQAFAAITTNGTSSGLYSIDLATGAATLVGTVGGGSPLLIRALTAAPQGDFEFSAPAYAVGESGPVAAITINRLRGTEGLASVTFTTSDNTATAPADYTDSDQLVTFGPGQTSQVVTIPIFNDGFGEGDETINLALTNPTNGTRLGTQSTAVLTITDDDTPSANAFGVSTTNNLVRFNTATPGTIVSSSPVTGLPAGENVVGIDFRPATGQLYALGSTSRLYIINPTTAAATQVGSGTFAPALNGTSFGFDFNPTVDRIRVVSDADQNMRLDPNTGTVQATDTNLVYAAGDPNAAANPNVTGAAYVNGVNGATTTTIFGIDTNLDILVRLGGVNVPPGTPSPNSGQLFTIGALNVNASDVLGFDIRGGSNEAFASLVVGGVPRLYTIDLASGAATLVGTIGAGGGTTLRAFALPSEGFGTTTLAGTTVTFGGSTTCEAIVFDQAGGLLRHNRFSSGDPGFNSDFDFDPNAPGDQTLSASNPAVTVIVNAGGCDDQITIGSGTAPASGLAASFQINGQAGGDSLIINDVASSTARTITINGATSTITGLSGPVTYQTLESLTVNAGSGGDTINVQGTSSATTNVFAGGGDDTVVFGNGATLTEGLVDGGAGTNALDYSAFTTTVSVDLSTTQTVFQATFSGAQEPGPLSSSPGFGRGAFILNAAQSDLTFIMTFQGIIGSTVTGNHFHNAPAGVNGSIVRGLTPGEQFDITPPDEFLLGVWTSSDAEPLTPALVTELQANRIYFNTHTDLFPSGELRGQLLNLGTASPATGTAGVRSFNNVTGGSQTDFLTGNGNVNVLRGGPGIDIITGAPGGDQMFGDAGDDLLIWNNGDGSDLMEGGADNDAVQVNGSPSGGDQFLIQVNPADTTRLRFDRTNLGLFNLNIGTTEALDFNTLDGDDTTTVEYANGNPIPAGFSGVAGLDYDGGTGADLLVLQRSSGSFTAATETYVGSGPGAGQMTLGGGFIQFSNLTPINDTVPVTNFTFTATASSLALNIVNGPNVSGFNTTQINDGGAGSFELINFAQKTNVTTISGNGAQLITVNNPVAAAGLSTLAVFGNVSNDTFNLKASTTVPISINGSVPVVAPGDTLNYDTEGRTVSGDSTPPDGTINSPGVQPVNFTGIEAVNLANVPVSINDISVTEGNSGPVNAVFTVTLPSATSQTVTVDYVTANGTATAPEDYAASSGTVTFMPGEISRTITVPVNGDIVLEADETFFVNLSNATNATIGDNQGLGTIVNDDATLQFSQAAYAVAENGGSFTTTVTRTGSSLGTVTVNFATSDGTAIAGSDYTNTSGTLTFGPGITSQTFNVPITDDALTEATETVNLTLTGPTGGASLGSPNSAVLSILDNESLAPDIFAVTTGNNLLRFNSLMPEVITSSVAITGLQAGENILNIDFRPATGQLYALGSTSRLYTVNTTTGVAAQVGSGTFSTPLSGTDFGFDFNPTVDRIRVVSDADQNLRLHPDTGAIAVVDMALVYAAGDVNVGANPNVTGAAYTSNSAGSPTTTLYGIDSNLDTLVRQGSADGTPVSPNSGQLSTIGPLLVNTTGLAGFDIRQTGDAAYASLTAPGDTSTKLYTINLQTGSATFLGTIDGAQLVRDIAVAPAGTFQFSSSVTSVSEAAGKVTITVNRTGDTSLPAAVNYSTVDGSATQKGDYEILIGTLSFAAGQTSKTLDVFIVDDAFVEGPETFTVAINSPSGDFALDGASTIAVTITDNDAVPGPNPIDNTNFFVRQHYLDFLNRDPDAGGFNFWTSQINSCGSDAQCIEVRRINVSASFFLSIEFQQTGYLVERFYKVAYGDATGTSTLNGAHQLPVPIVRYHEFIRDTQRIGQGLIVLQPGWEQLLEINKQAYAFESVRTTRFMTAFPTTMTPAQFVDQLNTNAGNVLTANERTSIINLFGGATDTSNNTARAQAVRQVAEDGDLFTGESNRAFVLAEYFGYLRRNPNDAPEPGLDYTGYDFWLTKLNQFNGNFIDAEMVKAFITSIEYRQRFGP